MYPSYKTHALVQTLNSFSFIATMLGKTKSQVTLET